MTTLYHCYSRVLLGIMMIGGLLLSPPTLASEPLSLEETIGQFIMIAIHDKTLTKPVKKLIQDYHIGGVMLSKSSIHSTQQVKTLIQDLQTTARQAGQPYPLFIAIDQEGGTVNRLHFHRPHYPSAKTIGHIGSSYVAKQLGLLMGSELIEYGINMNFSPVLDVVTHPQNHVIGSRSYGTQPDRVSRLGEAYIHGLQQTGIIATAKHFPGHGHTSVDSHVALPIMRESSHYIEHIDLLPFRQAIQSDVGAIMSAHVQYIALDPHQPASLSRPILTSLLREDLGFKGLIITDDIEMGAIQRNYTLAEAGVKAILAGNTMILSTGSVYRIKQLYKVLHNAALKGTLSSPLLTTNLTTIHSITSHLKAIKQTTNWRTLKEDLLRSIKE